MLPNNLDFKIIHPLNQRTKEIIIFDIDLFEQTGSEVESQVFSISITNTSGDTEVEVDDGEDTHTLNFTGDDMKYLVTTERTIQRSFVVEAADEEEAEQKAIEIESKRPAVSSNDDDIDCIYVKELKEIAIDYNTKPPNCS